MSNLAKAQRLPRGLVVSRGATRIVTAALTVLPDHY